ncbi:hypothetical protein ASC97_21070 [Rhizobium sp. Root1203]|uniref:hypothetical protein n=1 Tax=Rhizobium sp. Root1203 TaxID=1736427 RepID=UPI00070F3E76|nr:hypothetical protein [Rhizobium sp. Root1203]KQV30690.1 hypothetical protein ASC97_21070 [Rhizobium sp. Root1203]
MQTIFGVEQTALPFSMAQTEHRSLNSMQSGSLLIKSAMLCSTTAGWSAVDASDTTSTNTAAAIMIRLEGDENGMIHPISVSKLPGTARSGRR